MLTSARLRLSVTSACLPLVETVALLPAVMTALVGPGTWGSAPCHWAVPMKRSLWAGASRR